MNTTTGTGGITLGRFSEIFIFMQFYLQKRLSNTIYLVYLCGCVHSVAHFGNNEKEAIHFVNWLLWLTDFLKELFWTSLNILKVVIFCSNQSISYGTKSSSHHFIKIKLLSTFCKCFFKTKFLNDKWPYLKTHSFQN